MADRNGPLRILVTGGSQGAQALNRIVPGAVELLAQDSSVKVRHQAGKSRAGETAQAYRAAGIDADVTEFIEDMAAAYGWADIVVCRSGALTVSELAAAGVAAVLVPFPFAVDDHQTRNAEFLVDAGAAILMPEPELDAISLSKVLGQLAAQRDELLAMANKARSLAIPDAASRVAALCEEFQAA
jgi:UDP-N-acetylglucosamine--N-acetylmuramyl-(pentapeptide) pyrophosphoryl-undecaprenol N-acetylglucosamine transferase